MDTPDSRYIRSLDQDMYRIGNVTSSRLDHVRNVDVDTFERNGRLMVRANGKGIYIGSLAYLQKLRLGGWLWKVPAATALTNGLLFHPDSNPAKQGHFFLCPDSDMSMERYRGLLFEVALRCERTQKL